MRPGTRGPFHPLAVPASKSLDEFVTADGSLALMSDSVLPQLTAAGVLAAAATARAEEKRAASDPLKDAPKDPRMEEFKESPDPWEEIVKLNWGSDRTFASTLQTLLLDAQPSQYAGFEKKLLAGLGNPDCTDAARDWICRMLNLVGSAESVRGLQSMLEDEKQSDRARYALERIEDPAVDAAFRAALPKVKGSAKVGLIGALALRRDSASAGALRGIVSDVNESAPVREAAVRALASLQP